ncbi:hypothetical protein RRG08_008547 [Elysia crispata]|uniref:Uncharacterized protein n=1 Tax=Elysia crispata TaxID=231223 RepID=A0AAE0YDM2_9GAST|nr:hypothetical protein RRG08_008547 [Elysia crispata]
MGVIYSNVQTFLTTSNQLSLPGSLGVQVFKCSLCLENFSLSVYHMDGGVTMVFEEMMGRGCNIPRSLATSGTTAVKGHCGRRFTHPYVLFTVDLDRARVVSRKAYRSESQKIIRPVNIGLLKLGTVIFARR